MREQNKEQDLATRMKQSPKVEREKERLIRLVQGDLERRNQPFDFFRGATLETYAKIGRAQFIGHREKPEWKKDYQYNVFEPITRDKVFAIVSKASGLYEAQFFNTNKRLEAVSETISTTLGAFYQDSTRILKEKEKNKLLMIAGLTTPKAIWYEGWRLQKRVIREIEERDTSGEITKTRKKNIVHYNGPWGEIIPVEDFIPGSMKIRDLQEQPRITWAPRMQIEEFRRRYPVSKFPEAAKVQPHGALVNSGLTDYTVGHDLKENEVEVVMVFEKWDDKMSIIANGIMLTPVDSPMPFAHKDYPFVWGGFEELNEHFIYDMPLTIKLLDMQDVNDEILNLSLDMVWRALNEVILVGKGDGINDDVLYGGGLVDVDDPNNFNKLEFGSNFGFNAANSVQNRVRQSIESSSFDAASSGGTAGNGKTAREVLVAREAALEIASVFLTNMENMERDKAILRVKNQLDRYHRPIDWEKRIGEEEADKAIPIFREISVRNARLDGGKRGTVNVKITDSPRTAEELNMANVVNNRELSQTIDVSPEFIREIEFDVEVVANSSVKKSKVREVAEARAFLGDATAMPDVLSVPYAGKRYVKTLGLNEDEALAKPPQAKGDPMEEMMAQMGGGGEAPEEDPGMPQPKVGDVPLPESDLEAILNSEL